MKRFSTRKQDYYSILHIDTNASLEEIRAAYKRLALLTHPDRSRHPQANQQMQLLNEAYEVLSKPEKRARYDQDRIAPPAPIPVEKPTHVDHQTQVDRKHQKDLEQKRNRLLRNQLKMISYLIILTSAMFLWFLASGQVSTLMILLIVMLAIFTVASMILKVRNLDG